MEQTQKEKAISLVKKMSISDSTQLNRNQYGIQCALIAVNEMISVLNQDANPLANYWYKVKEEIEKLYNK